MSQIRVSSSLYEHLPVIGIVALVFGVTNGLFALVADLGLLPPPISLVLILAGAWLYTRICIAPQQAAASPGISTEPATVR